MGFSGKVLRDLEDCVPEFDIVYVHCQVNTYTVHAILVDFQEQLKDFILNVISRRIYKRF